MTISLSGLDLSFLDPEKKGKGRFRFSHGHSGAFAEHRSDLACPQIISDFAEPVLNHADGRHYGSKRAYEKAVARAGCEIVGNEKLPPPQKYEPQGVAQDIKRSIDELKSR